MVREFVGGGVLGELSAAEDAEHRAEKHAERERWRATAAKLTELDAGVAQIQALATAVMGVALRSAGYHQHARGAWRRRRVR